MTKIMRFLRDEDGASAAEYALILAVVGACIAMAASFLGGAISGAMNTVGNSIASPSA